MMEKRPVSDGGVAETGDDAPANSVAARRAAAADGGAGIERMLDAKLWDNPCWLAFRLNYLALRYNTPLYDWVSRTRGLSRVEYVVVYSLALTDGGQARDISETSGFPKNTLSRAIARLEELGLIVREHLPGGGRNQPLRLSEEGWRLFEETLPAFERFERMMLSALDPAERKTLSDLLAKVVRAGDDWPEVLTDPERDLPDPGDAEPTKEGG
jgi:DNA-binding MarR family transcriptional regulator